MSRDFPSLVLLTTFDFLTGQIFWSYSQVGRGPPGRTVDAAAAAAADYSWLWSFALITAYSSTAVFQLIVFEESVHVKN